jgi:hypothetical protein
MVLVNSDVILHSNQHYTSLYMLHRIPGTMRNKLVLLESSSLYALAVDLLGS